MTAQAYIQSILDALRIPAAPAEAGNSSPEDLIYARLMSKKFRKLKPADLCIDITKKAVARAVKNQTQVTISMCFGGNKLWRFEEAPEIDWAEFFSLVYYLEYAKTIAAAHKPGVRLDYFSQDVSVESLNNIPRSETDNYWRTFRAMINWIKPYLPAGVSVTYTRHAEQYASPDEYYEELEEGKKIVLARNDGKLPVLDDRMRVATELNVRLKPGQDDDPQWREKVELEHQAIFEGKTIKQYFADPDMIFLCPVFYDDSIVVGSTKHSMAKFWAGVGALGHKADSYAELVLTPKQLEAAQFDWEAVHLEGLEGKNFGRVRVLKS